MPLHNDTCVEVEISNKMNDEQIIKFMEQQGELINEVKQLNKNLGHIFEKYESRNNPLAVKLVTPRNERFYMAGGVGGGYGGGGTGDLVQKATKVYEYSVTLTVHTTQYTQALPANVKALIIRERTGTKGFYLSYQALTGNLFRTIEAGSAYAKDNLNLATATLYLRTILAGDAGAVIDIEAWV